MSFQFVRSLPICETGDFLIHVINIGTWGSAVLLQTGDGKNILIDVAYHSGTVNVIKYLDSLNVTKLDLLILSHAHVDHINGERYYTDKPGIQDFLDKYSPSCVWFVGSPLPLWYDGTSPSPSDIRDLHAYQIVLAQLFPNGYTVNGKGVIPGISGASIVDYHEPRVITGTDVYHIGRLYIKILNPGQTLVSNDINNDSLAMQFIWDGKVKLMYLSDTLYPTQDAILRKKDAGFFDDADLKADIMCIGHHGLADGLSEGFLDAVSPRYAFAQSDIGIVDSIKAMLTARNIAAYEPYTMNRNIIFKCNDTISILPDIPIASYNFQR